ALMQNVMSGVHAEDPSTVRDVVVLPERFEPLKGMKIALSIDLGFYEVDKEVDAAVRNAAKAFSEMGCSVEEVSLGWTEDIAHAMNAYVEYLVHSSSADLLPKWERELSPHIKSLIERGSKLKASAVAGFSATRRSMYEAFRPIVENYDLLLCPTLAAPGVLARHDSMDKNFSINGKPVGAYLEWGLTYPFNMLSYLPVSSVPCGFTGAGVPIGMQIVGRPFDDVSVFRASAAFESARPWQKRRPQL
ncbi:MAG: amidase family protein, partial [Parvibaculaceae bacterium]